MRVAIVVLCLVALAAAQNGGDDMMDMDEFRMMLPTVFQPTSNGDNFQDVAACELAGAPFCSDCENPGPRCYGCYWGYVLNGDYSGCTECSEGCRRCQWTDATFTNTECRRCYPGYVLNQGVCDACGTLCLECELTPFDLFTQQCTQCADRSVQSELFNPECISCGSNCASCRVDAVDSVTCTTCDSGYFVNELGSCEGCQSNCLACTESNNVKTCSSCAGTYQLSNDGTTCLPCPSSCASCSGESSVDSSVGSCTSCVDGYYLDGQECIQCTSNCISCTDANSCSACADEYYLTESGDSCNPCAWNCRECPDDQSCTTCVDGYTSKDIVDVTCDPCPSNCDVCTVEQAGVGQCTTCATGYYLDPLTQKCTGCGSNCDTCSNNLICTACSTGYVLFDDPFSTAFTCHACPDNCASDTEPVCSYNETSAKTYCTTCDIGFTPNDELSQCIACQAGCDYCKYNTTFLNTECTCPGEIPINIADTADGAQLYRGGCTGAASVTYACKAGYFYDEAGLSNQRVPTCSSCSLSGCDHCNVTDIGNTCYDCDSTAGYSPNAESGLCLACSRFGSQCQTCSNARCLTCSEGYSVYSGSAPGQTDGNCKQCGSNCAACTFSGSSEVVSTCSNCKDYGVRSSANTANCVRCTSPCTSCSLVTEGTSETTSCASSGCPALYVHDGTSACLSCPENCLICSLDGSDVVCTTCATGYGVDSSGTCSECPKDCDSCILSTEEGSTDLVCDGCALTYVSNTLQCAPCPSNCPTCTHNLGTISGASAAEFYYLEAGLCSRCPANCEDCTATRCNECVDGYALSGDSKSCVACPSVTGVSNCDECTDATIVGGVDTSICMECAAGYDLSDDKMECTSTADLLNCAKTADHGIECVTCDANSNGRYLAPKQTFYHRFPKLCAFDCYRCGRYNFAENRIEDGTADECDVEPEQVGRGRNKEFIEVGNYSVGDFCYDGFCAVWVEFDIDPKKKKSIRSRSCRGCNRNSTCVGEEDESGGVAQCTDYVKQKGVVKKKQPEKCIRCHKTNLGNQNYYSGATSVSASVSALLFALAYVFYNRQQ